MDKQGKVKILLLVISFLMGCTIEPIADNTGKVKKGDTLLVKAINGIHRIVIVDKFQNEKVFEIKYLKTGEHDYITFNHLNNYLQ